MPGIMDAAARGLIATILVNDCNFSRSALARGEDSSFSLILLPLLTLFNDHSLFCEETRCIYAGLRLQKSHTRTKNVVV